MRVSGATRILRISWDEVSGLMERAVTRGRARKQARIVRRIGVDEKTAETTRRHIPNIVTYNPHPVTNAMSEGLNAHIQKIKSMACGFRTTENFKTAIYFHCGGLDLYPC